MRSPSSLLLSREKRPNSFSLSSYSRFSSPLTIVPALLGTFSRLSVSFLTCGDQNWTRHSRGALENGFLSLATEEPTRRGAPADLPLTNKDELVGNEKVGGSLGCGDNEMVNLKILRGGSWAESRITTLDTSREQNVAFSGTRLEESHGIQPWRKEGSRRAG